MEEERKKEKKENFTELQKPNIEAEVYSNNKKCNGREKKLKSLIRCLSANKINNYNEGGKKRKRKKKKNRKESTEQVKT